MPKGIGYDGGVAAKAKAKKKGKKGKKGKMNPFAHAASMAKKK